MDKKWSDTGPIIYPIKDYDQYDKKEGKYQDVAEFIEFAKVKGIDYFKLGDLEFRFQMRDGEAGSRLPHKQENAGATPAPATIEMQGKVPVAENMPSDDELLFASVEPLEWKDPFKKGEK